MDLPKVIINDSYADYLNGKEVDATIVSGRPVQKGMRVMGFHNSIAVNTGFSVPRGKQAHYIGVEGMVTEVPTSTAERAGAPHVKIVKV